jgi:two-component system OmpR family sensor kinase
MSIKTRLTVAVAVVLLAVLTLLGVTVVRSTRSTLVDQVDSQVATSADRAPGGRNGPPPRDYNDKSPNPYADANPDTGDDSTQDWDAKSVAYLVYSPTGVQLAKELCGFKDDPKPPPSLPEIPSAEIDAMVGDIVTTPSIDGTFDYRTLVQRGGNGEYVVTAAPLDQVDEAVDRLVTILVIAGVAALAVAILASWWIIRRDLRPVDHMVDTAAAIAGGNLSSRVPAADPRTELGRLGGALNVMLAQIEQAVQARTASEERLRRFIADAAHELRTPLTSLRGYAELYRQGAISNQEGVDNAMNRIESEGARMARLVDDMLLLARLDQQRGLETTPIDMVELVREAISDFKAVDPERPLTEDLGETAVVEGDRVRLRQIIDNLLTNVRIHTPRATPVHVGVARNGDHVEVSVADKGPGIAPEDREHIFERFWRADPGRTRSRGGTGLGLAIVASLVHAHRGTITVISEPGQGTTFVVRLPLAED